MKSKIALIIPYFGQWPEWIDLYLKSCSLNEFIDFHFFTDCSIPQHKYNNTYFHELSWEKYQCVISETLNIKYQRESAYSLCDIKPFYGYIHRDILKKYDFWGYGDLDVCYGKLSHFINDDILKKKDVISTHADRISGHFALFRNTEYHRNLCFSVPNWREKLESDKMYGIDEHYFTELIFPMMKNIHRIYRYLFSKLKLDYRIGYRILMWPINKFSRLLFKEYYTTPAPKIDEKWEYDLTNGVVINPNGKELPYIHFLFFKKTPFYKTEHYWKPNFYKIKFDQMIETKSVVVFDVNGITYKND
ncbi:MAG: hypothetical protein IKY82_08410 [Alistipes sp.]|nr:hypothetical protein [Alistipes sp.]